LERLSVEQLKKEAQQFYLPTAGDKKSLIGTILAFLEKNDESSTDERPAAGGMEAPAGEVLQLVLASVNGILQQRREAQRQQKQFLEK